MKDYLDIVKCLLSNSSLNIEVKDNTILVNEKYIVSTTERGLFTLNDTIYKHLPILLSDISLKEHFGKIIFYFEDDGNLASNASIKDIATKTKFKDSVIQEVSMCIDYTYPKSDICKIYHCNQLQKAGFKINLNIF